MLSVPLCPSYVNIRYPSAITDLKISGVFQPILSINWQNFQVINIMTEHKIIVPYKISISIMTAVRLRKILKESFCANIVIFHHNIKNPIQTAQSSITPSAPLKPPNYMI